MRFVALHHFTMSTNCDYNVWNDQILLCSWFWILALNLQNCSVWSKTPIAANSNQLQVDQLGGHSNTWFPERINRFLFANAHSWEQKDRNYLGRQFLNISAFYETFRCHETCGDLHVIVVTLRKHNLSQCRDWMTSINLVSRWNHYLPL